MIRRTPHQHPQAGFLKCPSPCAGPSHCRSSSFSSDGRIFFADRNTGSIRIIQGGPLLAVPLYTLTNTATTGERGLLGLALDPAFPSTPYVYAYQTYNDVVNGTVYNRVRITANGN